MNPDLNPRVFAPARTQTQSLSSESSESSSDSDVDIVPPPLPSNPSSESARHGHIKTLIEASEANIARFEAQIRDWSVCATASAKLSLNCERFSRPFTNCPLEYRRYPGAADLLKPAEVVSHVCAHWRQVAITTPQLWTELLRIELDRIPTEAYCTGLMEWLGRSAPLPIDVQLLGGSEVDANDATAVMGALLTVAHRWSDAYLTLPSLSVLSEIPSDGLKQLRNLTLASPDTSSAPLVAFSLAPKLTKVTLCTPRIAPLQMPWSQLAHLTIATAALPQECLDTLIRCQNLVTASFSMLAWPGRPDVSELRPITFGKLESLALS